MAKGKQTKKPASKEGAPSNRPPGNEAPGSAVAPGTTGRYLVLLRADAVEEGARALSDAGVHVVISVDEAYLDRFSEVSEACKKEGLTVAQEGELRDIGVINGSIDEEKIDRLRELEGVSHIEPARRYRIAPPDSDVQ